MYKTDARWPGLDEKCLQAYAKAVERGSYSVPDIARELGIDVPEAERIKDVLIKLRVVNPLTTGTGHVTLDPAIAEAALAAQLETEISQRRQRLAQIHAQLRRLVPLYAAGNPLARHEESIRTLVDAAEVDREIGVATRRCRHEVMTIQPGGGRSTRTLRIALPRDVSLLERGVKMRVIYQTTAQSSLATRMYVRRITDAGGEVRVSDELFERLIIFDHELAFVPQRRERGGPPGAAVVSDPTIVDFCCRIFESLWRPGLPFDSAQEAGPGHRRETTDLQRAILRFMALGMKDDLIARRLGMSTRTCRRYISEIMELLDVTSRFQAGAVAARLGLVAAPLPGAAPEGDEAPA
jgi:DNA-binding CsgD family transcriptional regulator